MENIDIYNNQSFIDAVNDCVQRSIDACNNCGAHYDEEYLYHKWERRLFDAYARDCDTRELLLAYAEKSFAF